MVERTPIVEATTFEMATDITNGVFEGVTGVFAYDSTQVRCRTNFTVGYDAFRRMFLDNRQFEFGDVTF